MKVLVINGSPKGKRSNTWQLTRAFVEGMGEQLGEGALEERVVEVRSAHIEPCLGCFACWKSGDGTCCLNDDMRQIIADRVWADVTIWSFPLYYFSVPGPLKNLIDRQLPMALPFMEERADGLGSGSHPARYDLSGKRNVIISTCGFFSAEGNYDGVFSLFDHMCGKGEYESVLCGQGELFRVPELKERTGAYLDCVRQAGREFADGGIAPATSKRLAQLLYPRETFEAMADASWGISRETGEAEDEAITFTRQMATLYNPQAYDGTDRVLYMDYTDRGVGCAIVLGKDGSKVVTDGSVVPTTTIETPYTVWRDIAQGKISGVDALAQHQYRVLGDFDLMMNWDAYFGDTGSSGEDAPAGDAAPAASKPSTMLAMLVPWIAFWTAMSISPSLGPVITLAFCAATPLLFYRNEKTFYDVISPCIVVALVALVLVGVPLTMVLPLSYVGFGLMWLVPALVGVPLSAHYSKNSYGGNGALNNTIFVQTNRIICLVWGVTYLAAAVAAFLLVGTDAAPLVAIVNNILPLPAAFFTVWFQRWYPQKVARG